MEVSTVALEARAAVSPIRARISFLRFGAHVMKRQRDPSGASTSIGCMSAHKCLLPQDGHSTLAGPTTGIRAKLSLSVSIPVGTDLPVVGHTIQTTPIAFTFKKQLCLVGMRCMALFA